MAYFRKLNLRRTKEFLKTCKLLNRSTSSIPTLTTPSTTAHTNLQKAELLNSFFVSCFNRSHNPLDITDYSALPCIGEISTAMLCEENTVFDLLSSLDTSKSSGPDCISAQMLKQTAASIAPSVTLLFNQSLKQGQIPCNWKVSQVVPIPKVSPAKSPDNYRPVSLLSILSKILERHVYSVIVNHLDSVCPLSDDSGLVAQLSLYSYQQPHIGFLCLKLDGKYVPFSLIIEKLSTQCIAPTPNFGDALWK